MINKKVPEKQEISVSSKKKVILFFEDKKPKISYSIRCTNQAWGVEIAELIRNCTIGFIKTNVPFARFRQKVTKSQEVIIVFSFILIFLLSLVFLWIYSQGSLTSCRIFSEQIGQFVGDDILIGKKVDFLINFFNTCQETTLKQNIIVLFFTLFSFFPSLVLSFLISELVLLLIKLPTYRFLLFTEASKKERDEYFSKNSGRKNFWLMTVLVGSILTLLNRIMWNYISELWVNIFG